MFNILKVNKVIISCSTCCPLECVRATWVGASFDYNKVIISCSTCCPLDRVRATWVGATFDTVQGQAGTAADDDVIYLKLNVLFCLEHILY